MPGKTMASIAVVERDYTGDRRQVGSPRSAGRHAGPDHQGRHRRIPTWRSRELAAKHGVMGRGAGAGPPGDRHRRARWPRPSWRCPAPPTGGWPSRASGELERRTGRRLAHLAEGSEEKPHHLRRHPGPAGPGDHQPGMVRQRDRRPAVRPVHRQRRGTQALAHPHRADALLPRPRLDRGTRRAAADLPAAAGHGPAVRRARSSAPPRRDRADACGT